MITMHYSFKEFGHSVHFEFHMFFSTMTQTANFLCTTKNITSLKNFKLPQECRKKRRRQFFLNTSRIFTNKTSSSRLAGASDYGRGERGGGGERNLMIARQNNQQEWRE